MSNAVKSGKPVPPEVLKDYPELRRSATVRHDDLHGLIVDKEKVGEMYPIGNDRWRFVPTDETLALGVGGMSNLVSDEEATALYMEKRKQPWELTEEEYKKSIYGQNKTRDYTFEVRRALREGKSVPERTVISVLNAHPQLLDLEQVRPYPKAVELRRKLVKEMVEREKPETIPDSLLKDYPELQPKKETPAREPWRHQTEAELLARAREGSLSPYSTIHWDDETKKTFKRLQKEGQIIRQEAPVYSGPGNRYRYLAAGYVYDASGKGMPIEEYHAQLAEQKKEWEKRFWSPADAPLKKYVTYKQQAEAPVSELRDIADQFKPYYGQRVTIWGGGGAPNSQAILEKVEVVATKDRDGKPYGHSIHATFSDMDKDVFHEPDGKGTLSLGSWQVRVDREAAKPEKSDTPESKLQSIHDDRSPLSRASDERQSNLDTIDLDSPRTETWAKDPGRMDVRGIDTPRKKHRAKRREGRPPTAVRGTR